MQRALILAGGGLKVAFQAGVLQVWLDELQLEFDLYDGASGGTFNLAMLCQGMSGQQIADNWRGLPILKGVSPNWLQLLKLPWASSLLRYDRWRRNIYTHWGLDFEAVRSSPLNAVFNVYNFSRHRLETWSPSRISEDGLTACVSLPTWFEPVTIDHDCYIDAVYLTDANLIDAVQKGADELWIIWTVSERARWKSGLINTYFQVIETAGNGRLRADIARIETSNRRLAAGEPSEFKQEVTIKILRAEVPLHYLINFSSARFTRAVDLGVEEARRWCAREGLASRLQTTSARPLSNSGIAPIRLRFSETMKGSVSAGQALHDLAVTLTIDIDDVDHFIDTPEHQGAISGTVSSSFFGADRAVLSGAFNLFVDTANDTKRMLYHLWFNNDAGNPLTLSGFKEVRDDPGIDIWQDTTTLYVSLYQDRLDRDAIDGSTPLAGGTIRIFFFDFLEQLTTFRTEGPGTGRRAAALARFGKFFLGSLWQVYGNKVK